MGSNCTPSPSTAGRSALNGAIVKTAGVDEENLTFRGPARVFESQESAVSGILEGTVKAGEVVVIRYEVIDVCRVAYDYFVFGSGERIETGPVVIYEILTVIVCFSLYTYYRRSNRSIGDSSTMLTAECKSTLVDGSMSFGIGVVAIFLMLLPAGGPLDFLHYTGDFFITVALVALTIKEPFSVLKEAFVELVGGVHDDDETNAYVEAEAQRHLPANTDYEQTLIFKTGMNYTVDVYLSGIGETIDVADLIECKRSLEKELSKRLHIVDVDFVFD